MAHLRSLICLSRLSKAMWILSELPYTSCVIASTESGGRGSIAQGKGELSKGLLEDWVYL